MILLDVQLPDIDGFEVARRVIGTGDGAAVIIVSSHEHSDYGSLVSTSGARGFVTKAELSGERLRALLGAGADGP
jgi:DNA-binding NarL/FixJ family response regulator